MTSWNVFVDWPGSHEELARFVGEVLDTELDEEPKGPVFGTMIGADSLLVLEVWDADGYLPTAPWFQPPADGGANYEVRVRPSTDEAFGFAVRVYDALTARGHRAWLVFELEVEYPRDAPRCACGWGRVANDGALFCSWCRRDARPQ